MKIRCFFLLFALVATVLPAQDLPVTRVVLFTSGVGYFEHSGNVVGDAAVPLVFSEDQINDALKSLILRDPTGSVGVVGYPSQDPVERSLSSFALDLGGPGGLAALLPQLRGATLTLSTPTEVTGRLVGLDVRTEKDRPETWLTLASADGLRVIALSSVSKVKMLDPKLDQELSQALTLLAGTRDARKKSVTARFLGKGTRAVSLGYIAEAPVWKTSYRLDLTGGKPYLQAWAIVENTGESDWNQVRLSLVSGRPVSFIQDLYTPLYVQRPLYTPETEAGPAPRVNAAGMGSAPAAAPAPSMMAEAGVRGAAKSSMNDELSWEEGPSPVLKESGFRAAAGGAKAGELFQFTLQAPITLPRHQSALIPLTASDVTAQKVSLFNTEVDPVHPQNAVWLTNTTGLRLPAGPVTVYDGGTYAGDALTDSLVENDKRLWTYASDLTLRADVASSEAQTTTKVTIVRGILNFRKELTWQKTYRFANTGREGKTVLVEHPVVADRTLAETAKPVEKTPASYRFLVDSPAGGEGVLVVKESKIVIETQGISGWRAEQLIAFASGTGPLSPALKAALAKIAELKTAVDRASQLTASISQQKGELESGQGRIRSNLEAVGRDSAQGKTYLKRLLDSETQIDQLVEQLAAAKKAQAQVQKDWEDGVRTLSVE